MMWLSIYLKCMVDGTTDMTLKHVRSNDKVEVRTVAKQYTVTHLSFHLTSFKMMQVAINEIKCRN